MTKNLTSAIKSLEIDNRIRGLVTGHIELEGIDEIISLTLEGDCWSDLAGSKLSARATFEPQAWTGAPLPAQIRGIIGDCTASKRSRPGGLRLSDYENPRDPERGIQAFLTLEWFGEAGQRYVIDSGDFKMTSEDHQWFMEPEEEAAQKMANQQAMRDYVKNIVDPPGSPSAPPPEATGERAWEIRLQRSDRLNDAYQEVLSKYADDSDSETKEAFVMDWDDMLGSLADESERTPNPIDGDFTFSEEDWSEGNFISSDDNSFEDEIEIVQHPLQRAAHELIAEHFSALNDVQDAIPSAEFEAFYTPFIKISGKLAAALNDDAIKTEPGYSLAILKRCTNWIQEAISALPGVSGALGQSRTEKLKASLFSLRQDVLRVRRELKDGSGS